MSKLDKVKALAKSKNIKGEIKISTRPDKKFMLIKTDAKIIHFGSKGMEDFLDHNDVQRRKNFHNRFKNNVNYNKPYTAMYLARLLW